MPLSESSINRFADSSDSLFIVRILIFNMVRYCGRVKYKLGSAWGYMFIFIYLG